MTRLGYAPPPRAALTQQLAVNPTGSTGIGDGGPTAVLASGATYSSVPLFAQVDAPRLGQRRTLLAVSVPIALMFGVPAGSVGVNLSGHTANVALSRNGVPALAVDLDFNVRLTGTFGPDFYGGNLTLSANFPNPIDYLNGDVLQWSFSYQNVSGFAIQVFPLSLVNFFSGVTSGAGLAKKSGSFSYKDLPLDAPPEKGSDEISITQGDVARHITTKLPLLARDSG